ncbi:MAG: prepilin-type N-terminal cleavage/methylation domain-containing protein [bacterium]|nr:prepilin-type N-terminal cleavage/methylation domain-containing protein [bacterium]
MMVVNRRGLTLVETVVAMALVGLAGTLATAVRSEMAEDARSTKCQANLKRVIRAIHEYTADYNGVLPGPIHPKIGRHMYDLGAGSSVTDRQKSLSWLLRPYFPHVGDSVTAPGTPNPIVDEILTCPTANIIAPDEQFFAQAEMQTGCWRARPYNYTCNTWGPNGQAGSSFGGTPEWPSTDPPHYFGAWYYCDSDPSAHEGKVSWRPKKLERIKNASAEWAIADAWYRRIARGPTRPGDQPKREWLGTFAPHADSYQPPIPSAPYHRVSPRDARSHAEWGKNILPEIPFEGETNQAYFDGHVAPFKGQWNEPGEGGTVNPYWSVWGGSHFTGEPWYP